MLNSSLKNNIRESFNTFKNNMDGFVMRPAQNKMIAEISKTLAGEYPNNNKILCVEAPTGTGKTLAYLLSGIAIAIANKKKLIISSANVALQEQLLNKDIPQAQQYCSVDFEYALAKGRSRYVCIRNLINLTENEIHNTSLFDTPIEEHQIDQLNLMLDDYSNKKWSGEIDDLIHTLNNSTWQKVSCNRFTCTAKSCEFYHDCVFFKARKKITKADVIIANHDLILADLNAGNTILPNVKESIFIFDEAHHLHNRALSHFSLSGSTKFIKSCVKQTHNISKQLCQITQQNMPEINTKQIDEYLSDLIQLLKNLEFNEDIYLFEQGIINENIKQLSQNLYLVINTINTEFTTLKQSWTDYVKIQTVDKHTAEPINNITGECEQNLLHIVILLSSFLQIDDSSKAPCSRWIEKSLLANKKTNYIFNSAQTDIADNLDTLIWSKTYGAVLTSATLSSLGSFNRLNQQLGLMKHENQYLRLPSPFKFNKVDFIIAKFKSSPVQVHEHTQEVASQLLKRINQNQGSLVLFASNQQMQQVADLIESKLKCTLFVQGEYQKKLILEKYLELRNSQKGAVIFGLDSFSEGVDLKGDWLTHVVIVKLRFSVPTSPIDKTFANYLKTQNRNPFMEISLPDASMRLIQACGRLIRTETDTGKITIFDNRLVTKFYGKQLINALPGYNVLIE